MPTIHTTMILNFLLALSTTAPVLATFSTRVVYQSPTGLFLENIAVRPSGKLLLNSVASPTLHTLDPAAPNATLEEVYTFPNSTGLTGIVEYQPELYALVSSVINLTTRRAALGSVAIWRVDFTSKTPAATQIVGIPESTVINGLSVVPGNPDLILASDSNIGAVYEINMRTGTARIAIQDSTMTPGAPEPAHGINGLHVRNGFLYFANTQRGTFSRVPLAVQRGAVLQAGAVQVLGSVQDAVEEYDDFALDGEGHAWVATHPGALTLYSSLANGTWTQETAAGDPEGNYAVFTEPTSAAFGRGGCEKILYVTTGGGQIVSVDTGSADV
ncbi:hypothetical protein B0H17DRAFT_950057 [Mycena rosella]|uniref:SMP-30/Gluconolactonase/LRE-like region domain-containing protein n=1 Tax=Mycena rosella TaxID=1033263 RepID=A0AAD7D0X4_MYCRO|nr:hypothetical protein B0H17DRAFT_950057 [Mycena rosella]